MDTWVLPDGLIKKGWYPGYSPEKEPLFLEGPQILKEPDLQSLWIHNFHYPQGLCPMAATAVNDCFCFGSQQAAELLSLPGSRGMRFRWVGPFVYLSQVPKAAWGEAERIRRFEATIAPRIRSFPEEWETRKTELVSTFDEIRTRIGNVTESDTTELSNLLTASREYQRRAWVVHFELMYTCLVPYLTIYELFDELKLPMRIIPVLLQGQETRLVQTDKRIQDLARQAVNHGFSEVLRNVSAEELPARLRQYPGGGPWWDAFMDFLKEFGWRIDQGVDPSYPTWIEAPSIPLALIASYADLLIERPSAPLPTVSATNNRKQAEEQVLRELPVGVRRQVEEALAECRRVNFVWWNEEHTSYIDLLASIPLRLICQTIGRAWTKSGYLRDHNSIFFLFYEEVMAGLTGSCSCDHFGALATERRRYKDGWESQSNSLPPLLGMMNGPINDPIILEVHGLHDWYLSGVCSKGKAAVELNGVPASPGKGAGIARVVRNMQDLMAVKPGEVLVCEATLPSWTSVFSYISACVCDRGGVLTHAAIVSREYGLPCVVGTGNATHAIRTGDYVIVDGSTGLVSVKARGGESQG